MTIHCAYLSGIEAHLLRLVAEPAPGERGLRMTGLPARVADHTVRTAAATLARMGIHDPGTLVRCEREDPDAPPLDEDARIRGGDLPAVLAVLGVRGVVGPERLERTVAAADLDSFRPRGGGTPCVGIRGATPVAERAERAGLDLVVALDDGVAAAAECGRTIAVGTVEEAVDVLAGRREPEDPRLGRPDGPAHSAGPIWGIAGGTLRALEIACAGGHHMHLVGAPGRDSPARYGRVAQLMLPDLDPERSRETTRIHSVSGLMPLRLARISRPPLRAPHWSASAAAVTGHRRSPGEASLAHNGLLLLDEPAEFDSGALEDVARAARDGDVVFPPPPGTRHAIRYPARFQLIVTSRPEEADRGLRRAPAPLRAVRDRTRGGRRRRGARTDPRRVRGAGRRRSETAEPPAVGCPWSWIRPAGRTGEGDRANHRGARRLRGGGPGTPRGGGGPRARRRRPAVTRFRHLSRWVPGGARSGPGPGSTGFGRVTAPTGMRSSVRRSAGGFRLSGWSGAFPSPRCRLPGVPLRLSPGPLRPAIA